MPPCKFLTADGISMVSDTCSTTQDIAKMGNKVEVNAKQEYLSPISIGNLDAIETASSTTESSAMSKPEFKKPARIIYGNDTIENYPDEFTDKSNIQLLDEKETRNTEKNDSLVKLTPQMDHVYEEINVMKEPNIFEYDIMDYYEKYSPTTAKTLIDTLFLPRHKICRQCANLQDSPVYSDCLVYARKTVHAREVNLCLRDDALLFKYCPDEGVSNATLCLQYDDIQPCMLVYNYSKTTASSIFYYYHGPPQDIFELKSTLKPEMILLSRDTSGLANTELYHRSVNNLYTRVSSSGNSPMSFQVNHGNILSSIKHIGYDTDLQNWMNYRNDVFHTRSLKQNDVIDHRANRSSLLLLEPLLLMPELKSPRYRNGKNRISHTEHKKIVKIVIAYTLSFFILAIITFYIVYFT